MVRHTKNYKKKKDDYCECGGRIHWVTDRVKSKPILRIHEGHCGDCKKQYAKTYWSWKDEMIKKYLEEHYIYIDDKIRVVMECPNCKQNNVLNQGGCYICMNPDCGWSACASG